MRAYRRGWRHLLKEVPQILRDQPFHQLARHTRSLPYPQADAKAAWCGAPRRDDERGKRTPGPAGPMTGPGGTGAPVPPGVRGERGYGYRRAVRYGGTARPYKGVFRTPGRLVPGARCGVRVRSDGRRTSLPAGREPLGPGTAVLPSEGAAK
ncbi:hypothetical protein ACE1SV_72560 [Streptomyces sp. E-15]